MLYEKDGVDPTRDAMDVICEDIRKKLDDLRDRKLARPVQTVVEQHLHYCEDCILRWALIRVPQDLAGSGASR
jgi:hypothetical protein